MAGSTSEGRTAASRGREDWLQCPGGPELGLRVWDQAPDRPSQAAVVQVVHGLSEHSARYAGLAAALNAAGHPVIAHDVRGHGLTATRGGEPGHMAAADGWPDLVGDVEAVRREAAARWPGRPIVLFGHSMGSVLALSALEAGGRSGKGHAAAILSGPPGLPPPIARLGLFLARLEAIRLGQRGRSRLLQSLSFGAYARAVRDAATPFDWLSRDWQAVAAYMSDPWCGVPASVGSWTALVRGLAAATSTDALARLPPDLPLLILAGGEDPVGDRGRAVAGLADRLRAAGQGKLVLKLYPGARHELLNEVNRAEVQADLLDWLAAQNL